MKVPGADYTPIRQAISARTNARMATIQSRDAANAKNRYAIEQKGINLQRAQNITSNVLNLAQAGLNYQSRVYEIAQSNDNNLMSYRASAAGSKVDLWLAENGTDTIDINTGKFKPEYEQELQKVIDEAIGSDYKLDASMKSAESLKAKLLDDAKATAITQLGPRLAKQAENAGDAVLGQMIGEFSSLDWSDEMMTGIWFDTRTGSIQYGEAQGKGATKVPSFIADLVGSWDYMNDAEKYTKIVEYGQKAVLAKGDYMGQEHQRLLSTGGFANNEAVQESWAGILDFAENWVPDENTRHDWIEGLKAGNSTALESWFTEQISAGNDGRLASYPQIEALYNGFAPGKDPKESSYYGMFFDKDGNPMTSSNTFNTIQNQLKAIVDAAWEDFGTSNTAAVQSVVDECVTGLRNGSMDFTVASARLLTVLQDSYPDGWANDPEVEGILTHFYTAVAGDLAKNDQVKAYINISVANALFGTDKNGNPKDGDLTKLSPVQEAAKADITAYFIQELTHTLSQDPTKATPEALTNELKRLNNVYSHSWFENVYSARTDVQGVGPNTAIAQADNMIMSVFSVGSEDFDVIRNGEEIFSNMDEDGWVGGRDIRLTSGSGKSLDQAFSRIRQDLEASTGKALMDGPEIKFDVVDGEVVPVAVRFQVYGQMGYEEHKLSTAKPDPLHTDEEVVEILDDGMPANLEGPQPGEAYLNIENEEARDIVNRWSEKLGHGNDVSVQMMDEATTVEALDALWKFIEESGAYSLHDQLEQEYKDIRERLLEPPSVVTPITGTGSEKEAIGKYKEENFEVNLGLLGSATNIDNLNFIKGTLLENYSNHKEEIVREYNRIRKEKFGN